MIFAILYGWICSVLAVIFAISFVQEHDRDQRKLLVLATTCAGFCGATGWAAWGRWDGLPAAWNVTIALSTTILGCLALAQLATRSRS